MRRRIAAVLALALAACGGGGPREVPSVTFGLPPDTILTPYVQVPQAAALGGGKWVVVAAEFDEAAIIDFTSGRRTVLRGTRDVVLRHPFNVFGWTDTAYVADWSTTQVSRWTVAGTVATAPLRAPAALRGLLPSARDAAGNLYFEVKPLVRRDGSGNRDSAAIVRAPADLARFDTVARLSPLDLAEVNDQAGRRFVRRVFSGEDAWGVFADGTVWVARVYQNYIARWAADGSEREGPRLPDRVLEVSWSDREHFFLEFPEDQRSTAELLPWSPIKPPFERALGTPAGQVWLEKSRITTDSSRTYQVTDRAGVLSHEVVYPTRPGRVIALTDSLALVAEQWREGVRLMQVRVPSPPAATP